MAWLYLPVGGGCAAQHAWWPRRSGASWRCGPAVQQAEGARAANVGWEGGRKRRQLRIGAALTDRRPQHWCMVYITCPHSQAWLLAGPTTAPLTHPGSSRLQLQVQERIAVDPERGLVTSSTVAAFDLHTADGGRQWQEIARGDWIPLC